MHPGGDDYTGTQNTYQPCSNPRKYVDGSRGLAGESTLRKERVGGDSSFAGPGSAMTTRGALAQGRTISVESAGRRREQSPRATARSPAKLAVRVNLRSTLENGEVTMARSRDPFEVDSGTRPRHRADPERVVVVGLHMYPGQHSRRTIRLAPRDHRQRGEIGARIGRAVPGHSAAASNIACPRRAGNARIDLGSPMKLSSVAGWDRGADTTRSRWSSAAGRGGPCYI